MTGLLLDPIDAFVDEILSRAPDFDLETAAAHVPSEVESWFVRRAIAEAGKRLTLPRQIRLRFVSAPGHSRGQASQHGDIFRLTINAAECQTGPELSEVALHECQHLADLHDGTWHRLTRAELERRAIAFAMGVPITW